MAERIGVLGLARSGRAAARLARSRGAEVYASDAADTPALQAAAAELRALGGVVEIGGHSVDALAACELIVVSPGIPPSAGVLRHPALRGIARISELEFAYRSLSSRVIAVTGTNGKSTTTALAAHLLRTAGMDAPAAGNIGVALSEIALQSVQPEWVVVEASSFQLADIDTFTAQIGVFTNLGTDHLDRYASEAEYHADKRRLFDNATTSSTWVLNAEDPRVLALAESVPGTRRYFRVATPQPADEEGGYLTTSGELRVRAGGTETALGSVTELRLLGRHNHANALAAALAALAAGADASNVATGLHSFSGLEHRLELVGEFGGVQWINDSKATNVGSAQVAASSMSRPFIMLLGGRPKGEPWAPLLRVLREHCRAVLAYGEARGRIISELGAAVATEDMGTDFGAVVARAAQLACPGEAVLLSPACASFDMFDDYEDRGRQFKALVAQQRRAEAYRG